MVDFVCAWYSLQIDYNNNYRLENQKEKNEQLDGGGWVFVEMQIA